MSTRELSALWRIAGAALILLLPLTMLPSPARPAPQNQADNLAPPPGTILPVRLNDSLSSARSQPGQAVSARVMQDVPLPNGDHIRAGSTLIGHVVSAQPASESGNGQITIQFDQLRVSDQHQLPLHASLRALAGYTTLEDTWLPSMGPDEGTSPNWANTMLVGEGVRYGYYGPVTDAKSRVLGKSIPNGVLARPEASPDGDCDGTVSGENDLQAMWLFSPDACGVYGVAHVEISHTGRTDPQGRFTLIAHNADVKVSSGDGMLVRVISSGM